MSTDAAPAGAPTLYQQVKCKASASLQANNLTANVHHFAYIHKNEVHLIENKPNMFKADKVDRAMRASNGDKDPISWLELCTVTAGSVLVVVSSSGLINVYEQTGEKLMHSHKLQKSLVALSPKDAHLRGVAHDGKELLFLGAGSGDVLLFNITASKLSFVKKVPTGGNAAVHAVAYDAATGTLAAIDEQGSLFVWSSPVGSTEPTKAWEVKGNGVPATSVAVGYGYVITADINGVLRYYSIAKKELEVEICAHARSISTLHLHPTSPAVLTGSEDTFVSVWTLPTASAPNVKNVFQENIGTSIVVGARFIGDSIVCTVYDSRSLYRFAAPAL